MPGLAYVDTSAFLKLIVAAEEHHESMLAWVTATDADLMSSDLLRTEARRAVRGQPPAVRLKTNQRLADVTTVAVSREVCDLAAELDPAITHSLDAIHVATALFVQDELSAVLSYDHRMAEAVAAVGLVAVAPGADTT